MNTNPTPNQLSVIVIPVVGRPSIEECLQALQDQQEAPPFEIIVPHDSRLEMTAELVQKHLGASFVAHEGVRTFAELRASAVHQAAGQIIAITEDHCLPDPGWCSAIIKAHAAPHAAIGGVVDKRRPDTALGWAIYFADYLRYSTPQPEGPRSTLTDLNVTYKRIALDPIETVWSDEFHENLVHEAFLTRGETLWLSPAIRVGQGRSMSLKTAIEDRYAFGRLFASTRSSVLPNSRRLIILLASLLIPVLLVIRAAGHIRRAPQYLPEFLRSLPLLALLSLVWAWGEFMGYLTGKPARSLRPNTQPSFGNP